jgi:ABC-2 type transport system permease protein
MKRFKAIIRKELLHIFRDPVSLSIILLMPVIMILIYGYAINFDLNLVKTGIIDYSNNADSRQLINKFKNTSYFSLINLKESSKTPLKYAEEMLKKGEIKQYIVIPGDFLVKKKKQCSIGIVIDGSDSNVANLIYQYNQMVLNDYMGAISQLNQILKMGTKIYFNPRLTSSYFFVPGIIALILIMISALLTAISIAKEKEAGSIDLIFLSPLKSIEIIIGKTIPYLIIGLISESTILIMAKFWFKIPFKGHLLILLIFSILYLLAGLSIGILIATVTSSQKSALFAVLLITLLPTVMLSGFIFPLDSLSPIIRFLSKLVPATYFLKIIRGVILKGSELRHFIVEGFTLLCFSFILLVFSIKRFSSSRENK